MIQCTYIWWGFQPEPERHDISWPCQTAATHLTFGWLFGVQKPPLNNFWQTRWLFSFESTIFRVMIFCVWCSGNFDIHWYPTSSGRVAESIPFLPANWSKRKPLKDVLKHPRKPNILDISTGYCNISPSGFQCQPSLRWFQNRCRRFQGTSPSLVGSSLKEWLSGVQLGDFNQVSGEKKGRQRVADGRFVGLLQLVLEEQLSDTQPFKRSASRFDAWSSFAQMAGTCFFFTVSDTPKVHIQLINVGYPDIPTIYYIYSTHLYTNKMVGYIVLHDVPMLFPYPDEIHDFRPRRLWTCRRCCRGGHSSRFGGGQLPPF